MIQLKHTKGPWKVKHSESKDAFNVIGTFPGMKYKIARCPYYRHEGKDMEDFNKREREEAFGNAKLIEASPDMLQALKECFEWARQKYKDFEPDTPVCFWKAEQAILKATTTKP